MGLIFSISYLMYRFYLVSVVRWYRVNSVIYSSLWFMALGLWSMEEHHLYIFKCIESPNLSIFYLFLMFFGVFIIALTNLILFWRYSLKGWDELFEAIRYYIDRALRNRWITEVKPGLNSMRLKPHYLLNVLEFLFYAARWSVFAWFILTLAETSGLGGWVFFKYILNKHHLFIEYFCIIALLRSFFLDNLHISRIFKIKNDFFKPKFSIILYNYLDTTQFDVYSELTLIMKEKGFKLASHHVGDLYMGWRIKRARKRSWYMLNNYLKWNQFGLPFTWVTFRCYQHDTLYNSYKFRFYQVFYRKLFWVYFWLTWGIFEPDFWSVTCESLNFIEEEGEYEKYLI